MEGEGGQRRKGERPRESGEGWESRGGGETDRQTDRQRERDRDRETDTHTELPFGVMINS